MSKLDYIKRMSKEGVKDHSFATLCTFVESVDVEVGDIFKTSIDAFEKYHICVEVTVGKIYVYSFDPKRDKMLCNNSNSVIFDKTYYFMDLDSIKVPKCKFEWFTRFNFENTFVKCDQNCFITV
jgi:hypothetical protein